MSDSYFISAGEFSGDLLASDLVNELRNQNPHLRAFGVTGPTMQAAGVDCVLQNDQLAVMGVTDVLMSLGRIKVIEQRILQHIDSLQPRFAVLIDYPGFHMRLAEQLKLRGIPVVQYVAPKVWAWGQHRVKRIRENFDLVLGMLPFEEDFFLTHKVAYEYVGSPLLDRVHKELDAMNLESVATAASKTISFFPGSRKSEVQFMMPLFDDIMQKVRRHAPQPQEFIVSVAENLGWEGFQALYPAARGATAQPDFKLKGVKFAETYIQGEVRYIVGQSLAHMAVADAAIVTSGTSTLECALVGTPQVIAYKTQALTYALGAKLLKVKYIGLPNLIVDKEIVREFIQDINADAVADQVCRIAYDEEYRSQQLHEYDLMRAKLKRGAAKNAAKIISSRYRHETVH